MRGYMGGPGTSSKDFTWKIFHDIITCVRFSIKKSQDIMTLTLFQKTKEIEFSRGVCIFSVVHTLPIVQYPIVHFLKTIELYILLWHTSTIWMWDVIFVPQELTQSFHKFQIMRYISNCFDIMKYSFEADLSFCRRDRLGAGAAAPCRQALHSQVRLVDQAPLGSFPH